MHAPRRPSNNSRMTCFGYNSEVSKFDLLDGTSRIVKVTLSIYLGPCDQFKRSCECLQMNPFRFLCCFLLFSPSHFRVQGSPCYDCRRRMNRAFTGLHQWPLKLCWRMRSIEKIQDCVLLHACDVRDREWPGSRAWQFPSHQAQEIELSSISGHLSTFTMQSHSRRRSC